MQPRQGMARTGRVLAMRDVRAADVRDGGHAVASIQAAVAVVVPGDVVGDKPETRGQRAELRVAEVAGVPARDDCPGKSQNWRGSCCSTFIGWHRYSSVGGSGLTRGPSVPVIWTTTWTSSASDSTAGSRTVAASSSTGLHSMRQRSNQSRTNRSWEEVCEARRRRRPLEHRVVTQQSEVRQLQDVGPT